MTYSGFYLNERQLLFIGMPKGGRAEARLALEEGTEMRLVLETKTV